MVSKTKNKSHNESEHFKGQIKKLKSENKQLRQRLKDLDRQAHFYEKVIDEVVVETDIKSTCDNCGKGEILEYDLKFIVLEKCSLCDFQKKRKPRGKTKTE